MDKDYMKQVIDIKALAIFASLKDDPLIGGLCEFLEVLASGPSKGNGPASSKGNGPVGADIGRICQLYSNIVSALYPVTTDLGEYIRRAVLADDNFYVEAVAGGDRIGDEIQDAVKKELLSLQDLASLTSRDLKAELIEKYLPGDPALKANASSLEKGIRDLPSWTNSSVNLLRDFLDKLNDLGRTGYGIFAENYFFRISGDEIVSVPHPDVQPLSELFGYQRQKEQIIRNTRALLESDGPSNSASNILLYGDAGTGKSSTVKAVAFENAPKGLRLIEIKKDQLHLIPTILDKICRQPLKFILFVDDLSFSGNDDNFSTLKATLEGSITGRGDNAVIYATSNRRHLIRENFSDRQGDELHVNDTLQETMSLAARFGLTIMFENPDRDEYLDIVKNLAKLSGLDMAEDELLQKAEAHAIRRNGRSPRTARQFVELLKVELIR